MALTHSVAVGSLTVLVRELTVREVRDWALKAEQGLIEVDAVAALALDSASLQDIELMCDKTVADLEVFAPSELAAVVEVCRKLNPHFFRIRAAMAGAALVMQEQARQQPSRAPALS